MRALHLISSSGFYGAGAGAAVANLTPGLRRLGCDAVTGSLYNPSRPRTGFESRLESLGVLKAMAAHRPVLATRAVALPRIVEDGKTGILVDPGDPPPLVSVLNALLSEPARRERMGSSGRNRVETRLACETMARQYLTFQQPIAVECRC